MANTNQGYGLSNGRLLAIKAFVASHGHDAIIGDASVRFLDADGVSHRVSTMSAARRALGY